MIPLNEEALNAAVAAYDAPIDGYAHGKHKRVAAAIRAYLKHTESERYLKIPMMIPKDGDTVINYCDVPYMFVFDDDDTPHDKPWPIVIHDGVSMIQECGGDK